MAKKGNKTESYMLGIPWKYHSHGLPPRSVLPFGLGHLSLLGPIGTPAIPKQGVKTHVVQANESFTALTNRLLKMNFSGIMGLLNVSHEDWYHKALTTLPPGSTFSYEEDRSGNLLKLVIMNDDLHGVELTRRYGAPGYTLKKISITPDKHTHVYSARIHKTFNLAARASGLNGQQTLALEQLLSDKIKLNKEVMRGDRFHVAVQTTSIHGKTLNSRIVGVNYQGKRAKISLIQYNSDYYTPDGHSLAADFERYPFKGHFDVSSPFDLQRVHPITGEVSPHNGTDFAMPSGTQILAPSEGTVLEVGQNPYAGNYVLISHANDIKTRYLHLSKALVKQGDKVSMNQPIGLSGDTGRVTGPHLHYEVLVNNKPEDPMTVALPHHPALSGNELVAFKKYATPLMNRLGQHQHSVAQSDSSSSNTRQNG